MRPLPTTLHPLTARRTLDPILSLAQEIDLKPYAKTRVTFLTLAASSRAEALEKLTHYQTGQDIYRAFEEARAHSERELLELGLDAHAVEYIEYLLSALLYPTGVLRARTAYPGTKHQGAIRLVGIRDLWRLPHHAGAHP